MFKYVNILQTLPEDALNEFSGQSYLIVNIDSESQVSEINEVNNWKAQPITILSPNGRKTILSNVSDINNPVTDRKG